MVQFDLRKYFFRLVGDSTTNYLPLLLRHEMWQSTEVFEASGVHDLCLDYDQSTTEVKWLESWWIDISKICKD